MTREEYLQLRSSNNIHQLIYQVYTERFDKSKHGQFFSFYEMIGYLQMIHGIQRVVERIIEEYDVKFTITYLLDKDGNKIGII